MSRVSLPIARRLSQAAPQGRRSHVRCAAARASLTLRVQRRSSTNDDGRSGSRLRIVDHVDAPVPQTIGMPAGRTWFEVPTPPFAPGAEVRLAFGLSSGVASVHRRFALRLLDGQAIVAESHADVGALSARKPIELRVLVPNDAVGEHSLELQSLAQGSVAGAMRWPAQIAAPHVRLEARPTKAGPGTVVQLHLINDSPFDVLTGVDWSLQRRDAGAVTEHQLTAPLRISDASTASASRPEQ